MVAGGQPRRFDVGAHLFRVSEGGQVGHARSDFCAGQEGLPLPLSQSRRGQRTRRPGALTPADTQAVERARHGELFHVGGAQVGASGQVHLAGEKPGFPGLHDAPGCPAQASYRG